MKIVIGQPGLNPFLPKVHSYLYCIISFSLSFFIARSQSFFTKGTFLWETSEEQNERFNEVPSQSFFTKGTFLSERTWRP